MADITWNHVLDHYPELSTIDVDAQVDILAIVNTEMLNPTMFGGENARTYKLARIYLAAHICAMELMGADGAQGPVTSESAGGLSRSYASSGSSDTWEMTAPGKLLSGLGYRARGHWVL